MYDLLRLARRDGMLALEPHVSKPEDSNIFSKYPEGRCTTITCCISSAAAWGR